MSASNSASCIIRFSGPPVSTWQEKLVNLWISRSQLPLRVAGQQMSTLLAQPCSKSIAAVVSDWRLFPRPCSSPRMKLFATAIHRIPSAW